MSTATILVADDEPGIVSLLKDYLTDEGYHVLTAATGVEALHQISHGNPDLALLDLDMPKMSGYEVCVTSQMSSPSKFFPIIIMSGRGDQIEERVRGLNVGAYDFIRKPFSLDEILAKVRSFLRMKELYTTVDAQKMELDRWAKELDKRVSVQVEQMGHLVRFFSPQVANLILNSKDSQALMSHRREVTAVFSDLRGFTALAETVAPGVVMEVLKEYYRAVGTTAARSLATIGRLSGDGILVYFNDPLPIPNHRQTAIRFAVAARKQLKVLQGEWAAKGFELDFGFGIASGEVTAGVIGFDQYTDYTVIGTPINLAARLCAVASGGQILVPEQYLEGLRGITPAFAGPLRLHGIKSLVRTYNIVAFTDL